MRITPNSMKQALAITTLVLSPMIATAQAATYTWNSGSTDWNTATNWNPTTHFPGFATNDNAYFPDPAGLSTTVNVSSSVVINQIRFSTTTSVGYDITTSVGQTITLNATGTGSSGAINALNSSGINTVNANLILGAAAGTLQQFTQSPALGGTLIVNGNISGNPGNGLSLSTGIFTLTGNNSYTGNTQLNGTNSQVNVTSIGNAGASGNLGAGTAIEFISGIVRYTGAGETTSKGITFTKTSASGATLDGSGSGALVISGNVTSAGGAGFTQTLTLKGDNAAVHNGISGNITDGNGPVSVFVSSGRWALSGNNTFSGIANRVYQNAALDINSAQAMGGSVWKFDSGAIIDNTSAGNVTITSGATYAPGSFTFIGTHDLDMGDGAVTLGLVASNSAITVTARTLTFGGDIGQSAAGKGLTKEGAGTLVLGGTNSYTGSTTVNAGTLRINGDASAATGNVTVNAGGTLGGSGTIGGATTLNGILSPGSSPGTLTFANNLTVNNGATYVFEAGDLTVVGAALDLNDNWTLALGAGFQNGGSVTLFTYGTLAAGPDLTPTFDITNLGFTPGSLTLTDTGTSIVLNGVSINVIPEPATLALMALGGLMMIRRRRCAA